MFISKLREAYNLQISIAAQISVVFVTGSDTTTG